MSTILPPEPATAPEQPYIGNGPPELTLPPELSPDLDKLVTEDGKPVDNIYVEREYTLLTDPLYSSWSGPGEGRSHLALANVGWFHTDGEPPFVPDVLLSLDVRPRSPRTRAGRSYIQWILGKAPDLAIEIVSDHRGGEDSYKFEAYCRLGLSYYIIHDPENVLDGGILRAFELRGRQYHVIDPAWIPYLGLGLTMWQGVFEGIEDTWLRWCDAQGQVLPTGLERSHEERRRADEERRRADEERRRADEERRRADEERHVADEKLARLREQLRALGVEPEA